MLARLTGNLQRIRRTATHFLPYRPTQGGKRLLDTQYASGEWDYLRGSGEVSRFSVVAGYLHFLKLGGAIAEIGAGDGILHERLDRSRYRSYLGVDISDEAIKRVASRSDAQNRFIAADAATYVDPEVFDAIVFNEVLEYFDDPLSVVLRWTKSLAADGIVIVSMFDALNTARSIKIWRSIEARFRTVASTQVRNEAGYRWTIRVLRPL